MKKKIKLHLQKYIFYDLLVMILFFLISNLIYTLYNDYQENIRSNSDYSNFDSVLMDAYDIKPELFEFNNDTAIVEMSSLMEPITNGNDTMYFGEIPITKDQNQCVGYIIVKKVDNIFKFDYSHLCDMVDY